MKIYAGKEGKKVPLIQMVVWAYEKNNVILKSLKLEDAGWRDVARIPAWGGDISM